MLLQVGVLLAAVEITNGASLLAKNRQQPEPFFTETAEMMDELPPVTLSSKELTGKKQCHPKCTWSCSNSHCDTKCKPKCAPPKCINACSKPVMSKCQRKCQDPQCRVVCPKQCEHGGCPDCHTVCGEPVCTLDCGQQHLCETKCEDPVCAWDCAADEACKEPQCNLVCEGTARAGGMPCKFGEEESLPNEEQAAYTGKEITWKGFGKVPAEHLKYMKALPLEGATLVDGAIPVDGNPIVPISQQKQESEEPPKPVIEGKGAQPVSGADQIPGATYHDAVEELTEPCDPGGCSRS